MPNGDYGGGHGTLGEIHSFPRIVEWTIPDFFQLSKKVDYHVTSPTFRYWLHRCVFLVWPNGTVNLPGVVKFTLWGIAKAGSDRWKLEVLRTDSTVLRKCGGWKQDGCEVEMNMFIPFKEVHIGCHNGGFLSVRCTLHCEETLKYPEEKKSYVDAASQTEATPRTDKLSYDIEDLFIRGDDSDVTIRVEGEEFKTHKNILGARAPVFTCMFKHKMSENITNIVDIHDCDSIAFQEFLHYLYSGRVENFSPNTVYSLYKVADKYQVNALKAYCLEYIKNNLSINTFCDAVILSLQYDEEELMDIATKFLSQNMTEISDTEEWQNFSYENPSESNKFLLEASELQKQKIPCVTNPSKILSWFRFLKKWVLNPYPDMPIGNIEEIHSRPRIIQWTIPDFFQLPKITGYSATSPTFKFQQYRCKLVTLPNGTENSPGIVMLMLKGIGKTGVIRWELEIRRTDDTVLRKCGGWKDDGCEVEMDMFIPFGEVQTGCYDSGFLRVKVTLFSEETLNYPEKEESYVVTDSQTEAVSRTDKLSCDLEDLFIRGDDSNVTIRVESEEFKAHKSILAARTPIFISMLKHKMSENNSGIVDIDDCDPTTFREFLRYIYAGRVAKLSLNSMFRLHEVADKYEVNELKAYCVEYLKTNLSVDSFCDAIKLSLQYNEEQLINLATKFLSENMTDIKNTQKWQNFSSENPSDSKKLLLEALKLQTVIDS